MTGKILDERYELIEKIGSGGMADVYKAKDILLDRIVAVKILHSSFAEDNDFIVRFRHEAQSAGKLSHPNIVGIYDVGCDGDVHYIVMEYVEGETLKQYIQNHPNIPIDTAVRIAIEIGYALEEAHANGIIHCDIKPHNVLLTRTGKVKVTDFGIARAINSSTVLDKQSILGSVHYLSPEQAAGDKITAKTDIYSLGIVLYEMLTHHLPFEGETAVSIALQHMQGDIPRPTKYNPAISPMLEECLLTALQKDPDKRYDTVSDFISELKIAQGFTTTIYKPASHDFTAMTRPIPKKEVRTHKVQRETKLTRFITNLPQKYIWIGMAVLFIICFAWAFFSFGNFWSSENITVPNVVGKPVEVAETTLKKLDLKVSVDEIASDDVPAGQVISQTPAAGTNVKARRIIHLTVSKGGSAMLIPDLKGLTLEQAKERLDKMGLTLGAVENGNDPDKPSDVIISQSPESGAKATTGAKATKGTRVNIVINMKQKVHVPNVVGMTLADARNTLLSMKLSVGTINASDGTSTDDSSAIIISQDPAGGESTSSNVVNLTVGKKKSQTKTGTVNISIPKGGNARQVEIYVTDDSGKHTAYSGKAAPGSTVSKDVSGSGNVHVQVVIDGSVVQDREL